LLKKNPLLDKIYLSIPFNFNFILNNKRVSLHEKKKKRRTSRHAIVLNV